MRKQLEIIMKEYGGAVYRFALSRCGDADAANDVCQQTFLLLLEKKPHFSDKTALRRWLFSAARKLTAAARRAQSKSLPPDAEERGAPDRYDFELYDLISTLPEKLREATFFYYVEGYSVREIAALTRLTESAVKMRLARARDALGKIYKEEIL